MRKLVIVFVFTAIAALSATTAEAQTSKACGLLTAAEVAEALKRPDVAKQRPIGSADPDIPGASDCGYGGGFMTYQQPTLHKLPGKPALSIEDFDRDAMARVKSGEFVLLRDVGDVGWFYVNKSGKQYGALMRVGQQVVRLSLQMSAAESEAAARGALTALARKAAAKLR